MQSAISAVGHAKHENLLLEDCGLSNIWLLLSLLQFLQFYIYFELIYTQIKHLSETN